MNLLNVHANRDNVGLNTEYNPNATNAVLGIMFINISNKQGLNGIFSGIILFMRL